MHIPTIPVSWKLIIQPNPSDETIRAAQLDPVKKPKEETQSKSNAPSRNEGSTMRFILRNTIKQETQKKPLPRRINVDPPNPAFISPALASECEEKFSALLDSVNQTLQEYAAKIPQMTAFLNGKHAQTPHEDMGATVQGCLLALRKIAAQGEQLHHVYGHVTFGAQTAVTDLVRNLRHDITQVEVKAGMQPSRKEAVKTLLQKLDVVAREAAKLAPHSVPAQSRTDAEAAIAAEIVAETDISTRPVVAGGSKMSNAERYAYNGGLSDRQALRAALDASEAEAPTGTRDLKNTFNNGMSDREALRAAISISKQGMRNTLKKKQPGQEKDTTTTSKKASSGQRFMAMLDRMQKRLSRSDNSSRTPLDIRQTMADLGIDATHSLEEIKAQVVLESATNGSRKLNNQRPEIDKAINLWANGTTPLRTHLKTFNHAESLKDVPKAYNDAGVQIATKDAKDGLRSGVIGLMNGLAAKEEVKIGKHLSEDMRAQATTLLHTVIFSTPKRDWKLIDFGTSGTDGLEGMDLTLQEHGISPAQRKILAARFSAALENLANFGAAFQADPLGTPAPLKDMPEKLTLTAASSPT